ncbi:Stf0 family sulfotransferase [Yoonia sp. 2307UL14-13]|uniref:Stf0 family sulfotransferase n=1 Tax=Yoonia sp. 2307UL14-13 TaxID=3126506 RepID=UPI0030B79E93
MRPERGYLICTMPRSGSTLLCDLLKQTKTAGKPDSFFRPQSMADFAARWDVPAQTLETFDHSYLGTALDRGTAGTGCFGMRIMWNNIPGLITRLDQLFPQTTTDQGRLQTAFGPLQFIHLFRRDKVAEAVSYAIAEQSGLWHRNADGTELERVAPPAEPVYDAAHIHRTYRIVTEGGEAWLRWFETHQITPFALAYEDLACDPVRQLHRVLQFLGRDPSKADGVVPGTARLADGRNAEWVARFRAEAGIAPAAIQV